MNNLTRRYDRIVVGSVPVSPHSDSGLQKTWKLKLSQIMLILIAAKARTVAQVFAEEHKSTARQQLRHTKAKRRPESQGHIYKDLIEVCVPHFHVQHSGIGQVSLHHATVWSIVLHNM